MFFDDALWQITSLAELKVTLAIIRATFGWHKKEDQLSLSQLESITGMTRESVANGVKGALSQGLVKRRKKGQSFVYGLRMELVGNSDQFEPEVVGLSDQLLVGNSDPQKKEKEKEQCGVVFEFWKTHLNHPRSVLDAKRKKAIIGRLRDGHSVEDLILAVRGCKLTPHNMGQNDRGDVYDDLELICRDTSHVERFMARVESGGRGNGYHPNSAKSGRLIV